MRLTVLLPASLLLLTGCEQLGIENPAQLAAAKEAEGRAIGGACRHSGRALEDCYALNAKAQKAAIFSGWRDMDAYMRENSIETVPPVISKGSGASKKPSPTPEEPPAKVEETPSKKGAAHSAAQPVMPTPANGGKMV